MNKRWTSTLLMLVAALFFTANTAHAQLAGHNSRGDYGLQSGTQAPPGWYLVAPMY
jgi:hypothetical protein